MRGRFCGECGLGGLVLGGVSQSFEYGGGFGGKAGKGMEKKGKGEGREGREGTNLLHLVLPVCRRRRSQDIGRFSAGGLGCAMPFLWVVMEVGGWV